MQRYVAGFAFNQEHVLLVRKKVPRWQAGLLNAVGGKIEGGEPPVLAMCREFKEEVGINTVSSKWACFCVESHVDYEVHFYKARLPWIDAGQVPLVNDVGEELRWYDTRSIERDHWQEVIGNLHWLIPMAQDWRDFQCRLTVKGDIKGRPVWGVLP